MIGSGILFKVLSMQVVRIAIVLYNYVYVIIDIYVFQYHRYSCTAMDWILSE